MRRGEVTLGEELIAVEPYLDIQRLRFADWLRLDYRIDDRCVDCLVPRFILQPLIEECDPSRAPRSRATGDDRDRRFDRRRFTGDSRER
jgi:hypothetical protein